MKNEQTQQKPEKSKFILRLNDEQRQMAQEGLDDYNQGRVFTTEEVFRDLLEDEEDHPKT